MEKKLPKVFANNLNEINNNKFVFYSSSNQLEKANEIIEERKILKGKTIDQKISEIFSSPTYVYKAEVEITLNNQTITKNIIGKNRRNLVTMDNELIPIDDIRDIKYK